MEKQYKPVPDVEALRYKGTPDKPDIKIFVSHRIDLDSETIDNPLYIPVRCGAVFDEREGVTMLGDDTGDNISEKAEEYSKLTVLYWAWKNINNFSEYIGFTSYDKYFCFDAYHKTFFEPFLTRVSINSAKIDDSKSIRTHLLSVDAIFPQCVETENNKNTDKHGRLLLKKYENRQGNIWSKVSNIVREVSPKFVLAFTKYEKQYTSTLPQCFIMRKHIFAEYCEWLFPILFRLEEQIDFSKVNSREINVLADIADDLLGVFLVFICQTYCCSFLPVITFEYTEQLKSFYPFSRKNNIPIIFGCSDGYVPYASVFLQSIVETASNNNYYDVIVMERGIQKSNKTKLLQSIADKENISLRFINPSPLIGNIKLHIYTSAQSIEAYYRILVPFLFTNYDRAIVIDCDLILKEDISGLFFTDLKENVAGAVKDIPWISSYLQEGSDVSIYCKETYPIERPENYVNTGVLILDLKRFRDLFTIDEILTYVKKRKFKLQEQDALNLILQDKFLFLDTKWNFNPYVNYITYDLINYYAPISLLNDYKKARESPAIIHWAAYPKPWQNPEMDFAEEFWSIARRTLFYEILISRLATAIYPAVHDLQIRTQIFDTRTRARKFADKWLPPNSRRRALAKRIAPRGSLLWRFMKQIQYLLHPEYRPKKETDASEDDD